MNPRFPHGFLLVALALLALPACQKSPPPPPPPTPTPKPTPSMPYVPAKRMDTARMFSDIQVNATVETVIGATAREEKEDPGSYTVNLQVKVRVPKPHTDLQDLRKLNDSLPKVLPWLEAALPRARVSRFYDDFYRLKVDSIKRDLVRLDRLISRQHFFDCETAIDLQGQPSKRRAILIQSAMDVDTDGSDTDRVPVVDGNSSTFQPMTSYLWPKKTDKVNPFLASSEETLRKYTQELASKPGTERTRELNDSLIPDARYAVTQLKKSSFLIAATDPYIVVPGMMMTADYEPYRPKIGDYCVVIYNNVLYPAIIGDAGPNYKVGEASLRICREINARATANNSPVSSLKVTYLIFPNSADKPFDAPDLDKWRSRCEQLLNEMGGYQGELKAWEDLTKPKPTPTPPTTPTPAAPTPGVTPAASPAPAGSPAASVTPATPAAGLSITPSVSPPATPAAPGTGG